MNFRATVTLVLLITSALLAGCTGQSPAAPAATPATTAAATPVLQTSTLPAIPPELAGNWTLTTMGIQGGTAVVIPASEFPISFSTDGSLSGYDGCDNYFAAVTVTGTTTPRGKGMTISPVGSSRKYCADLQDQEQRYLHILEQISAYDADSTRLTLTATTGDVLIYKRPSAL